MEEEISRLVWKSMNTSWISKMTTEALLQKYVTKGLTPQERYELEKRALDDAFLADAWEGLQLYQGKDLRQKWNSIHDQWQQRSATSRATSIIPKETKTIKMPILMRYAAAAVLLLLASLTWVQYMGNDTTPISPIAVDLREITTEASPIGERDSAQNPNASETGTVYEKNAPKETSPTISGNQITTEEAHSPTATQSPPQDIAYQGDIASGEEKQSRTIVEQQLPLNASTNDAPQVAEQGVTPSQSISAKIKVQAPQSLDQNRKIVKLTSTEKRVNEIIQKSGTDQNAKATALKVAPTARDNSTQPIEPTSTTANGLKKLAPITEKDHEGTKLLAQDHHKAARTAFKEILQSDPKHIETRISLGRLYAQGAESCGDSWQQSLAVIAAYEQLQIAINLTPDDTLRSALAAESRQLSQRFPLREEAFMRGVRAGDTVSVACWIDEQVVVRFREK